MIAKKPQNEKPTPSTPAPLPPLPRGFRIREERWDTPAGRMLIDVLNDIFDQVDAAVGVPVLPTDDELDDFDATVTPFDGRKQAS